MRMKIFEFIKWGLSKEWKSTIMAFGIVGILLFGAMPEMMAADNGKDSVSLNLKNVSVEEFVEVMKQKTGVDYLYNALLFQNTKPISVQANGEHWQSVLKRVLEQEGFTYDFKNGIVAIRQMPITQPQPQPFVIYGYIYDTMDIPITGASVVLQGTTIGVSSDYDGYFTLQVPQEADTLIVSFIGMKTQYIKLNRSRSEYIVRLHEDVATLQDVVITGYGNIEKRNYTGAITTIKAEDVITPGASTIDQMLQGVVPGMLVQNVGGMLGTSPKIRVRGTSTLLGSQEPVWVVDGVIQRNPRPFNSDENTRFSLDVNDVSKLAGNAISWLNPHDIETITILKDASATAIYGSQAANGVIVITTKKGTPGKVSIGYNVDLTIGQRPSYGLYDRMNSQEIMEFSKEMIDARVSYPTPILPIGYAGLRERFMNKEITFEEMNAEYQKMARQNTDWFGMLFRNSFNHRHSLSISGGSDKIANRTSLSVDEQKGEAKGNNLSSVSVFSNTEIRLSDNFLINWTVNGGLRKVAGFAYGVNPFDYAYNTTRAIPAYNDDGTYYFHEKWGMSSNSIQNKNSYNYNIFNELDNTGSTSETRDWGTTVDVNWDIFSKLKYQGVVSYGSSSVESKEYATERSFYMTQIRGYEYGTALPNSNEEKGSRVPFGGVLNKGLSSVSAITVRNSLTYSDYLNEKNMLLLTAGLETNSTRTTGDINLRYGYLRDRGESFAPVPHTIYYLGYGTPQLNMEYAAGSTEILNRKNNLLSTYAQAVYVFDQRYILNLSARMDASNRFGQDKNKRFAPTWSAGVKWNIGNEALLKDVHWLNVLDVSATYGYQGNAVESVSPYLIARAAGIHPYYKTHTLNINSLPYPNLGWEKTESFNLGVNTALWDGRVNANFNYYVKNSDVLSSRDIPFENGVANAIVSGSTMKNSGYEFVVEFVPIRTTDFSWHFSVNSAIAKNEIVKNDRINTINDYLSGSAIISGQPFSTFYSYEFIGLDQENGTPLFKNIDLENVASVTEYLVQTGKFTPDFSGGFNTMVKYKNWSMYALFSLQWGGSNRLPEVYHATYNLGVPTPEQNLSRKIKDRWRNPNDNTIIPSIPGIGKTIVPLPQEGAVFTRKTANPYHMYNMSDIMVARTDLIRCNSISLEYEFGHELLENLRVRRLLLKGTMQNPFMWVRDKKWEGIDPETASWPVRRTTSLSVQVIF